MRLNNKEGDVLSFEKVFKLIFNQSFAFFLTIKSTDLLIDVLQKINIQ